MSKDMLGEALRNVCGPLMDFNQKLAGPDGIQWLEAFKRFLRKENPWAVCSFPTWKTIKLGTGLKTADDFRRAFKADGLRISDWANDLLNKQAFKPADKETEVDLVVVSVAELGFPQGATRQEIYNRAQKLGLDLCPPEVGPQLRLQYKERPMREGLLVGMEPITDSDGFPYVFRVVRVGDDLWLSRDYGYAGRFWGGNGRWVFLRRKSDTWSFGT